MAFSSNLQVRTSKANVSGKMCKNGYVINYNNDAKTIDYRNNKHVKLHGFPDSIKDKQPHINPL